MDTLVPNMIDHANGWMLPSRNDKVRMEISK